MKTAYRLRNLTVADIISDKEKRRIPQVKPDDGVSEIVAAFYKSRHTRLVYVVNEKRQLHGAISLGNLEKHILFHLNNREIDNLHLTSMAFTETAEDYIERPIITAKLSENIHSVLTRMLESSIKEIPIVDDQGRLVADLTLIEILNTCLEDIISL